VDDPALLDWPLDDPLMCMAIAFMRQLAIQYVKKWREKDEINDGNESGDWWKEQE
jgi:hypothetical protein